MEQIPYSVLDKIKEISENADGRNDRGIINPESKSSMLIRGNGDVSLAADVNARYTLNAKTGAASEISTQSTTTTVRKVLEADDIVINNHKLNPDLYELADMRSISNNQAIGNLTMFGTVLVKTWEPTLKKWVLMRRLTRMPLFSPLLNIPDAPEQLSVNSNITEEIKAMNNPSEGDE